MSELLRCIKKMETPEGLVVKYQSTWFYAVPPARIITDIDKRASNEQTREWLREVHAYFSSIIRESRSHHTGGGGFALNKLIRNARGETSCGVRRIVKLCREIVDAMGLEPLNDEDRFTVPSKW